MERALQAILDILVLLGGLLGGFLLLTSLAPGVGAPALGAAAAVAIGCAVIPYCLSATHSRAMMRRRTFLRDRDEA